MKSDMLSVVVGTEECIAKCPFCVSCEKVGSRREVTPNYRNFNVALKYAEKAGVNTMVLTSRGEPLLYPKQITQYLVELRRSGVNIPFVELQSNLILNQKLLNYRNTDKDLIRELVEKEGMSYREIADISYFELWYKLGLTHVAISTVSIDNKVNALNYLGNEEANYPDLSMTIRKLHAIGFTVRLVCVMCEDTEGVGYCCTTQQMKDYIVFARNLEVEQLTFRPVNEEYRREDAHNWCAAHLLSDEKKGYMHRFLSEVGSELYTIPKVGVLYDVDGVNVMFSAALTKYTPNTDRETTRQLIFFPDGRLRYEWEKPGAILL